MKYCSKCGSKIEENSLFCSNCGAKVELEDNNKQSAKKKTLILGIIVCCLLALFIFKNDNTYSGNVKELRLAHFGILAEYTNLNTGTLHDNAMKNLKYTDTGEEIIVTGTDRMTKDKIVITYSYEIDSDGDIDFTIEEFTRDGVSKGIDGYYYYFIDYLE